MSNDKQNLRETQSSSPQDKSSTVETTLLKQHSKRKDGKSSTSKKTNTLFLSFINYMITSHSLLPAIIVDPS